MPDLSGLADVVVLAVKTALAPLQSAHAAFQERLSGYEARLLGMAAYEQALADVRDRVVTFETKAAQPVAVVAPVDLSPVLERVAAVEAKQQALGDLRDRVLTVETKAAQPVVAEPVDLGPVLERVSAAEARLLVVEAKAHEPVDVSGMQERVEQVKSLSDVADLRASLDITHIRERLTAIEQWFQDHSKELTTLRERVAVAEVRQPIPGPPGEKGADGQHGKDGKDGKDGADGLNVEDFSADFDSETRSLALKLKRGDHVKVAPVVLTGYQRWRGVYQEGQSYDEGDTATWAGSMWHCNGTTTAKPGEGSKSWTLVVKRGRDGRDGMDAPGALPVVSVGVKR